MNLYFARIASRLRHASAAIFLAFAAAACGGALTLSDLFSSVWSADRGAGVESVRRRIGPVHPAPGANVVIGVAADAERLFGVRLADGVRWSFEHPLDARPVIASSVVVGSGGGEIFCLDARTGKMLWARPTGGLPLIGAGDDGQFTMVSLGRVGETHGSTLLAVARGGAVKRQIESDRAVGVPAMVGGLAFIPFRRWSPSDGGPQVDAGEDVRGHVSVFDVIAGDEPARIGMDERISRAWTQGGNIYFGEESIWRFDPRPKAPPLDPALHVTFDTAKLPGPPMLFPPMEARPKLDADASDSVRLYALPVPYRRFYATYFRAVMAVDPNGETAWTYTHPDDVLGAAAAEGGLIICDEKGKVTALASATGDRRIDRDLGGAVRSCIVQVDGFVVPGGSPSYH